MINSNGKSTAHRSSDLGFSLLAARCPSTSVNRQTVARDSNNMNIDEWAIQVSTAYQSVGLTFSSDKQSALFSAFSDIQPEIQNEITTEALDVMTRFFFKRASTGETFGALGRFENLFGRSIEENYGLPSGPFINMAKTYWTFRFEVDDISPKDHDLALSKILRTLESTIAGLFFPTPGPIKIPTRKRRKDQREVLQEYAPQIDIDSFLGNNPILGASLQDKKSFRRAYQKRDFLFALVLWLGLSAIINTVSGAYYLLSGELRDTVLHLTLAVGSFVFWYLIHNWALRHPRD